MSDCKTYPCGCTYEFVWIQFDGIPHPSGFAIEQVTPCKRHEKERGDDLTQRFLMDREFIKKCACGHCLEPIGDHNFIISDYIYHESCPEDCET